MSIAITKKSAQANTARKRNGTSTTISHVAQLAGVSRATAACAFSKPDVVAEKTRIKVFDAAGRLNYRPNVLARGLAGGKTHTIAVIWSLSSVPVDVDLTQRLAGRLQEQGYLPYICDMPGTYSGAMKLIEDFARRGVDGLIVAEAGVNMVTEAMKGDLRDRFRAVVLETSTPIDAIGCDEVVRDRTCSFREAAAHFVRSGLKHPLLVMSGPSVSQIKIDAFTDECQRHSLELMPSDIIVAPIDTLSRTVPSTIDMRLHDLMLDGRFPFDAVMCGNDMIALTVQSWLRCQGLRVPEDVALIGFNNSEMASLIDPPLASVDRRTDETLAAISEMLFARLENPDLPLQRRELSMQFIWRESAGGTPV